MRYLPHILFFSLHVHCLYILSYPSPLTASPLAFILAFSLPGQAPAPPPSSDCEFVKDIDYKARAGP